MKTSAGMRKTINLGMAIVGALSIFLYATELHVEGGLSPLGWFAFVTTPVPFVVSLVALARGGSL